MNTKNLLSWFTNFYVDCWVHPPATPARDGMYQSSTGVNARLACTQKTRCTHVTKKIAIVTLFPKISEKTLVRQTRCAHK